MIKNLLPIILVALLSYGAGVFYTQYNAPRPCIANYHSMTLPWFSRLQQEMLENTEPYSPDSDFSKSGYKSPSEFIKAIIADQEEDSKWKTEIFANPRDGKEYIVPGLCYVGEVNWLGEPILYYGNK